MNSDNTWVTSAGGPLILIPESVCHHWGGAPDRQAQAHRHALGDGLPLHRDGALVLAIGEHRHLAVVQVGPDRAHRANRGHGTRAPNGRHLMTDPRHARKTRSAPGWPRPGREAPRRPEG